MLAIDSAQLHYLETVLGIQSVLVPEGAQPLPTMNVSPQLKVRTRGRVEDARLIAVWARSPSASGEAEILAEKMVAAMKIASPNVYWIDWTDGQDAIGGELPAEVLSIVHRPGPPVLVFGESTAEKLIPIRVQTGRWIDYKGGRFMVTLSPEVLLDSAEKKKIAWAHLQTVMKAV